MSLAEREKVIVSIKGEIFPRILLEDFEWVFCYELTYLMSSFLIQESRALSPATAANHLSSILYPVKFEHADRAPKYDGIQSITQIRALATQLSKTASLRRRHTREELELEGKWVSW